MPVLLDSVKPGLLQGQRLGAVGLAAAQEGKEGENWQWGQTAGDCAEGGRSNQPDQWQQRRPRRQHLRLWRVCFQGEFCICLNVGIRGAILS